MTAPVPKEAQGTPGVEPRRAFYQSGAGEQAAPPSQVPAISALEEQAAPPSRPSTPLASG